MGQDYEEFKASFLRELEDKCPLDSKAQESTIAEGFKWVSKDDFEEDSHE